MKAPADTATATPTTIALRGRPLRADSEPSIAGTQELYVAALSGGTIVGQPTLVAGGTKGSVPRWSRDGRRLFFAQASPDRVMSVVVDRSPSLRASTPALAFDLRALRLDPHVWAILPGDRLVGIQRGAGEDEVTSSSSSCTGSTPSARGCPAASRSSTRAGRNPDAPDLVLSITLVSLSNT
jgi:hypothetical protein